MTFPDDVESDGRVGDPVFGDSNYGAFAPVPLASPDVRDLADLGAVLVRVLETEGLDHYAVAMNDPEGNGWIVTRQQEPALIGAAGGLGLSRLPSRQHEDQVREAVQVPADLGVDRPFASSSSTAALGATDDASRQIQRRARRVRARDDEHLGERPLVTKVIDPALETPDHVLGDERDALRRASSLRRVGGEVGPDHEELPLQDQEVLTHVRVLAEGSGDPRAATASSVVP